MAKIFSALVYAFGYFAFAFAGLKFAAFNGFVSPIWPAAGLGLFAVSHLGPVAALPIFLGSFFANWQIAGASAPMAVVISIGAALEAVTAGWVFHRAYRPNDEFLRRVGKWIFSISLGCVVGGVVGASALLHFVGKSGGPSFFEVFYTWWSGDFVGALIFYKLCSESAEICRDLLSKVRFQIGAKRLVNSVFAAGMVSGLYYAMYVTTGTNEGSLCFGVAALFAFLTFRSSRDKAFALSALAMVAFWVHHSKYIYISDSSEHLLSLMMAQLEMLGMYLVVEYYSHSLGSKEDKATSTVMMIGAVLIGIVLFLSETAVMQKSDETLKRNFEFATTELEDRYSGYVKQLKTASYLLLSAPDISSSTWESFAKDVAHHDRYPAMINLGWINSVKTSDIASFESKMSRFHGRDTKVHSVKNADGGDGIHRFVIFNVAPVEQNRSAIGLELSSEKNRRNAILRAESTGEPAFTGPIRLVQDPKQRPGMLLIIHSHSDKLTGETYFVYAPIVAELLFQSAFNQFNMLKFQVSDVTDEKNSEVIFASGAEGEKQQQEIFENRSMKKTVTLGGRKYSVQVVPAKGIDIGTELMLHLEMFFAFLVTFFVSFYVKNMSSIGRRAQKLADEMSAELDEQRAKSGYSAKMSALGEMAGGVAHEINNPLAIISALSEQVRRKISDDTMDKNTAIEKLAKVEATAKRIAKIVKSLKSFSRNGDLDEMVETAPSQIVADCLDLCLERFKNQGVEVRSVIGDDSPIMCRPVQISQVLLNLLNNAYDAIESVSEKWIMISVDNENGFIRISITDSGAGIPAQVAEKIMQPFFTTKEVGKGTGLGLSISKGIIEQHKGKFWYNAQSANTQFIIELPLAATVKKAA